MTVLLECSKTDTFGKEVMIVQNCHDSVICPVPTMTNFKDARAVLDDPLPL